MKVWILLGYISNILGYPSKYCNYSSKKKFGQFPPFLSKFLFPLFLAISGSSKIHCTHKHSNTCHGLNFHHKLIFLNARKNVHYQNQKQFKLPKNTNYQATIPLNESGSSHSWKFLTK